MNPSKLKLGILGSLILVSVPLIFCVRCGSNSASSTDRLLLACSRTDGNSCYEIHADSSVSAFSASCMSGTETTVSACTTTSAFGSCVTPTVGGSHDIYYYYNFGYPQNCSDLGGTYTAIGSQHIVGSSAATYTEANETSNSVSTTPENTSYTLNATGIVISGTFEASNPTVDYYSFNSGTSSYVVTRAFLNGVLSSDVSVSQKCTGYSVLTNVQTSGRDGIPSGTSCNVYVTPTTAQAGASYTIEMKALP